MGLPDLRADVDRDGFVSTAAGAGDEQGETRWSRDRGAVFLPNIDDDSRHCPRTDTPAAFVCNDAADEVVNGAADALDLARLRTVPEPRLPSSAWGRVRVVGPGAAHTRIFLRRPHGWRVATSRTRLTAADLRRGVELGMEGKDVVRDLSKWNGEAVVEFSVTGPGGTRSDRVTMGTAPLLTHHHLQPARRTMVVTFAGRDPESRAQRRFVSGFAAASKAAGLPAPLRLPNPTWSVDHWTQDFVEPGYVSMPAPHGRLHSMRVLIRSAQLYGEPPRRRGAAELYPLRGRDVAVLETAVDPASDWSLNSLGNLETIPPYTYGGRSFPAGRIIMGQQGASVGTRPARTMLTMLLAQRSQSPLLLDTSWLHVGHVDEFVQFLPARTRRGWKIGVADPRAGLAVLDTAVRRGHGSTRMFSWPGYADVRPPKETIADTAGSKTFRADNLRAARHIDADIGLLRRATGITDAEIVRVPALYTSGVLCGPGRVRLPALTCPPGRIPDVARYGENKNDPGPTAGSGPKLGAYTPDPVNGVLLGPHSYLAPAQWGPVINGRDIFTTAVTAAYRAAGIQVGYLDDFSTHHLLGGEVHCGTNTLRDATQRWWSPQRHTPAR
ncbi:protein-arginine deiminase family protein [Streptomyces sp. AM6-12]|uniref:protein-arginine deiminase family protein n=1 Tax=Streptomyces sp. AM6-12 TaxID=3345149 RepID=UPI0037A8001C